MKPYFYPSHLSESSLNFPLHFLNKSSWEGLSICSQYKWKCYLATQKLPAKLANRALVRSEISWSWCMNSVYHRALNIEEYNLTSLHSEVWSLQTSITSRHCHWQSLGLLWITLAFLRLLWKWGYWVPLSVVGVWMIAFRRCQDSLAFYKTQ